MCFLQGRLEPGLSPFESASGGAPGASTGTKIVVKGMRKIAQGEAKDEGRLWFQQLRDKRKSKACAHV